jgi:4-hydroxybenzoate polyprenyltransferase
MRRFERSPVEFHQRVPNVGSAMANADFEAPYAVLGLPPDATQETVRRTYLELVNTWRTDSIDQNPALQEIVRRQEAEITAAYTAITEQWAEAIAQEQTILEEAIADHQPTPPAPTLIDPALTPKVPTAAIEEASTSPAASPAASSPISPVAELAASLAPTRSPNPAPPEVTRIERSPIESPSNPGSLSPDWIDDRNPNLPPTALEERALSGRQRTRVESVLSLLRWDKPTGRLILLIPALWALFLVSRGRPSLPLLLAVVLGTIATSAVGCIANDLWDRDIDPQVERTRNRPLAARSIGLPLAIGLGAMALLGAWLISMTLNPLSRWLCVAAVPVILLYPAAKRVFPVPQLILSIAWGFAVLIPWTAGLADPNLTSPAMWMLWAATVCWTLGFDTVYAMADRQDDEAIGIQSSARFFGDQSANAIGFAFIATALFLMWMGFTMGLKWTFWLSVSLSALWWWQQHQRLQGRLSRGSYGQIFTENAAIGLLLLLGMITGSV